MLRLFKEDDSNVFWMGRVTGVTDNATEYDVAVTHVDSNGTFTAADNIVVSFVDKGDTGSNGADGADAALLLTNQTNQESTNSAVLVQIGTKSYTVAADTLEQNGEKLVVTVILTKTVPNAGTCQILINSNWFTAKIPSIPLFEGEELTRIEMHISRVSNTSALVEVQWVSTQGVSYVTNGYGFIVENTGSIGVVDFSGANFDIDVFGSIAAGGTLYAEQLTVKRLKLAK